MLNTRPKLIDVEPMNGAARTATTIATKHTAMTGSPRRSGDVTECQSRIEFDSPESNCRIGAASSGGTSKRRRHEFRREHLAGRALGQNAAGRQQHHARAQGRGKPQVVGRQQNRHA